MEAKDTFSLTWCEKHKNWWVTNCPDCMVDANEEDIRRAAIWEVVEWENNTFNKSITLNQMRATTTYQAQLKDWGIE